jgi:alpha-L-fucosidase
MMQPWFSEAKLGIMLHWGIYAVNGIPESWSFFNRQISYADYFAQCAGFTAEHYDPRAWAALFERAGARYAVLTTKHHDGVALFDSALSDLTVVQQTPAGRDVIAPYAEALRERGLKVGFYFSHLDWSHPDYAPIPPEERTINSMPGSYAQWPEGPHTPAWQRYLDFRNGQLQELCTQYGQVDLLWFDGDWEPGDAYWQMKELREQLQQWQPEVILNSRMRGYGDYKTPEQGVPIMPPEGAWEFSVTMNDSWGYQPHDMNYKSMRQLIRMFAEVIGMGGNMLLDIGPKPDGTIPAEQVERLEAMGEWMHRHAEAIYPTTAGLPLGHLNGASTLSKDRETLYVFLFDRPWDNIPVKGIHNEIKRISVVGSGQELSHRKIGGAPWMHIPGVLWIDVPEEALNPYTTVLKVELEGPLKLYHGAGQEITAN